MKNYRFYISFILAFFFSRGTYAQIPINENVKFDIFTPLVKKNGLVMNGSKYIKVDIKSILTHNDLEKLVLLLNTEEYDFSALIYLYAYTKKDAFLIASLVSGDYNMEVGRIVYSEETAQLWRKLYKKEEIEYWNRWLIENIVN